MNNPHPDNVTARAREMQTEHDRAYHNPDSERARRNIALLAAEVLLAAAALWWLGLAWIALRLGVSAALAYVVGSFFTSAAVMAWQMRRAARLP